MCLKSEECQDYRCSFSFIPWQQWWLWWWLAPGPVKGVMVTTLWRDCRGQCKWIKFGQMFLRLTLSRDRHTHPREKICNLQGEQCWSCQYDERHSYYYWCVWPNLIICKVLFLQYDCSNGLWHPQWIKHKIIISLKEAVYYLAPLPCFQWTCAEVPVWLKKKLIHLLQYRLWSWGLSSSQWKKLMCEAVYALSVRMRKRNCMKS